VREAVKKYAKNMKLFGFTTEAHHGNTNKKREQTKNGNNDDPQISRSDLRFASRKTAKQHKTGPEPHQTKTTQIHGDCLQTR